MGSNLMFITKCDSCGYTDVRKDGADCPLCGGTMEEPDWYDEDHLERCIKEILDPVDDYTAGQTPEGPWYYKSLTIKRKMNDIIIEDVDGVAYSHLVVPDLSDHPDPHGALRKKLDEVNEESLAAL